MNRIRVPRLWPLLVVATLVLAGCQYYPFGPANPIPPPTCEELTAQEDNRRNLSFETIAREFHSSWEIGQPGIFVLMTTSDVPQIEQYIRDEEVVTALQETNFDTHVVVVAFSGSKSHGGWAFCVTSVTKQNAEVILHTHLVESPVVPDITASYYHVFRLLKKELPTGEITFQMAITRHEWVYPTTYSKVLETSEEEIVASATRSIP